MKKIFSLLIMGLIGILFGIKGVCALENDTTVTKTYIDNVWSFHYRDGKVWTYGNLPYNYANGKLAYCIQPDSSINTSNYSSYTDFSITGYSEEDKRQMELISYYGYGFKNHNTLKYYMATQELIWLLSKDEKIKWTVSNTSSSEEINVENEKKEILSLIEKHNLLPSFAYNEIKMTTDSKIELIDENNVLENYNISSSSDINIEKNGNKLIINSSNIGNFSLFISPIENYNDTTVAYDNENIRTQDLAIFGKPELRMGFLYVNVDKSKVKINKKDKDTGELILDLGNKIKINDQIYEFNNGEINLNLPVGKYVIEEVSASNNYYVNKEKIEFEITNSDKYKEIDFYNEKTKGKISINKTDENKEKLSNVKFEIYNENNDIVDTIVTSNNEYDESKILPLGKYFVKEVSNINGYEIDKNIYEVNLKYNDDNIKIVNEKLDIVNKKIKCEIVIISKDNDGNNTNIYFDIYNDKKEIVYSGKTEDGLSKVILEYGNYYIKENKVDNGYKINEETINFTVNDDFCNAPIKIINEKVLMPVTSAEKDLCYTLLFFTDILGWIFVKKYC